MASTAILNENDRDHVGEWLLRACVVNPADRRAKVLATLYKVSPRLCAAVLRTKSPFTADADQASPFADLDRAVEG